jgi:NifB/MoaA-like Fe-S oxidoreductase
MNISRKEISDNQLVQYGITEIAKSIKSQEEILRKKLMRDSSMSNTFNNTQISILTKAAKSMLDFAQTGKLE